MSDMARPRRAASATAVDEVVVTGALRDTRLQDAPMAVTAVAALQTVGACFVVALPRRPAPPG